jgi:hypothetical protein
LTKFVETVNELPDTMGFGVTVIGANSEISAEAGGGGGTVQFLVVYIPLSVAISCALSVLRCPMVVEEVPGGILTVIVGWPLLVK